MFVIDANPDPTTPPPPDWHVAGTRARQVADRQHRAALAAIHAAQAETQTQIARADTKASALIGLFGAALAGALALAHTSTGLAAALMAMAILPLTGSVIALLLVLLARPGRADGIGRWALFGAHPDALIEELTLPARHQAPRQATHLARLAGRAVAKYRAVNTAIALLLTGLLLLTLAVLV